MASKTPLALYSGTLEQLQSGDTLSVGALTVTGLTAGSVLFAGAGGAVSQNSANLVWDDTAGTLKVLNGTTADQLRLGTAANYYSLGRNTATGGLDITGTQTGFTGLTINGPLVVGGTDISSGYYLDIIQSSPAAAGFRVTNSTAGALAQIQSQLRNDVGSLAYYGLTSSTYTGFGPINSGRAFWMSYACDAVFGSQTANAIRFTQAATEIAQFDSSGTLAVSSTADSTTTATGSVLLSGGMGVAGSITAGGWYRGGAGHARLTANVTNATTTVASLSGLSTTLVAGRKYCGRMVLKVNNSTATGGIKIDLGGGSATMTSFWAVAAPAGTAGSGGTIATGTMVTTAIANAMNYTTITGETLITVEMSMVVNVGGTFIPRVATNSAGTVTAELGSYLWLEDMPA